MADYYSIIAKAVRTLDPNTGDTRRRLYERARGALLAEMSSAALGLDKSDILAAQRSLEEAIRRVEGELQRDERERQLAAARPPAIAREADPPPFEGVVEAPGPPANQNGKRPRASLLARWTQVFRRPGDAPDDPPRRSRGEVSPSRFPDPPPHVGNGRDTWMSDLLARASVEEDEDFDQDFAPPKKVGRGA
jgi:hypothetical protein